MNKASKWIIAGIVAAGVTVAGFLYKNAVSSEFDQGKYAGKINGVSAMYVVEPGYSLPGADRCTLFLGEKDDRVRIIDDYCNNTADGVNNRTREDLERADLTSKFDMLLDEATSKMVDPDSELNKQKLRKEILEEVKYVR
ncbi:hypothetical protein HN587_02670 [Candidatus Woesearchaeota archaeon]|nr:hypothetical protein [Candidatus Woesearchaeota archaeon]